MASTKTESADKSGTDNGQPDLFRHVKRPQWGVAILAWEKDDRRAYQFEDGRLRKFKKGYYDLLEPVEEVAESKEAVVSGLEDAVEAKRKDPSNALDPVAPFKAQVELFEKMFPEGFQDPEWVSEHRGDTPGRALKRHRDPARQETQTALSEERCTELLQEGKHDEIHETATEILGGTSLVALKHVKVLRKLDEEKRKEFAESVVTLLHGEGDWGPRFEAFFDLLEEIYGKAASWRIATALPALMYPSEHICVRHSAFSRQAASISPLAQYTKRADVDAYKNFRRVGFAVRKRLQSEGHEPRDLLDIHDFIWATLRNAALDDLGDSD